MKHTTMKDMLHGQLNGFRIAAVAARESVAGNHQPPYGFGDEAASMLKSIARANLSISARCEQYAEEILSKPAMAWTTSDVDMLITAIDDGIRELATTATDEIEWRTRTFFAYWRRRLDFIRSVHPVDHVHEANVLVWAALDALANLWANGIGKGLVLHPSRLRETFDMFLAQYGGEPFRRVSLPDVWHRADTQAAGQLSANVHAFLKTAGGRREPTVLERRRVREVSEDPELGALLSEVVVACPGADRTAVEGWLSLSRYGSIAYKRMRSAYIHEGRSGKGTHGFQLYDSSTSPTYLGGVFGTPAVIGFAPQFMTTVLERCIGAFEIEALAMKADPVPRV